MAEAEHAANRRHAILRAAAALFDAGGYAATTMDEVAAEAGISKGSVYNYFQSKHDLFTQLFVETTSTDEAAAAALFEQPGPATGKIVSLLDYWFSRLEEHQRLGRLTLEFWANAAREQRKGDLAALLQSRYAGWVEQLGGVIAEGARGGEFRPELDPRAAATLLIGVINGLLVQMILNVGMQVDDSLLPALKRAVLAGLGARTDRQGAQPARG